MKVQSNSIQHNAPMSPDYTFDGANRRPHLKWDDFPPNTKSFAISCIDPDAPAGDWVHWLVHNIPTSVVELGEEDIVPGTELPNDFGNARYEGPSPPKGTGVHRYIFTVFALPQESVPKVTKTNFTDIIPSLALDKAMIIGTYTRD